MIGNFLKRASIIGALFFLALPVYAASNCSPALSPDWQMVAHVHDGDSLKLTDGRKIRLIGINTPEVARDGKVAESYANEARNFVLNSVKHAGNKVGLIYDEDPEDHYGRTLAHIILPDHSNLTEKLLLNGLGSHIAIAPNLQFNSCYKAAQQAARKRQHNLWRPANKTIIRLDQTSTVQNGFRHVLGQVTRIGRGPKNIWLNFDRKLAIRIAREDLHYFTQWQPSSLLNKKIEASGWVYTTKGQQRMRAHHPSIIHVRD